MLGTARSPAISCRQSPIVRPLGCHATCRRGQRADQSGTRAVSPRRRDGLAASYVDEVDGNSWIITLLHSNSVPVIAARTDIVQPSKYSKYLH
jgi:hypothetical protein